MPVKKPQGNALILSVLRTPLHGLFSGMTIELSYTGRRTRRQYSLPLQYARDEMRLVVVPQGAEAKTWWRNFLTPQPVRIRLKGRLHDGLAHVVHAGDPAYDQLRQLYERRWRRLGGPVTGPLVEITLRPEE